MQCRWHDRYNDIGKTTLNEISNKETQDRVLRLVRDYEGFNKLK